MPLITIFTAPKPFLDPHISTIQKNAILSWVALGPQVEVFLVGNETGMAEAARELGVRQLPEVRCNPQGTPLVSSIFALARDHSSSPLLAYVNADVLLLPDFVESARYLLALEGGAPAPGEDAQPEKTRPFLVVGQRWDLDVKELLDFSPGWAENLRARVQSNGRLHLPAGSDYFIFPRDCFTDVPDFAIGRAGWDNWMIYRARCLGWPAVDATTAIMVIHQSHDYSHLPGGQPHYNLPETDLNVSLGGGRRTIFKVLDASHRLQDGQVRKIPLSWARFWREVEIFPLVKLHSMWLGWIFYGLFHPIRIFGEARGWLAYKLKRAR